MIKRTLASLILASTLFGCYNEISYDDVKRTYRDVETKQVKKSTNELDAILNKHYIINGIEIEKSKLSLNEQIKLVEWSDKVVAEWSNIIKDEPTFEDSLKKIMYSTLEIITKGDFNLSSTAYPIAKINKDVSALIIYVGKKIRYASKQFSVIEALKDKYNISENDLKRVSKLDEGYYARYDKAYVPLDIVLKIMGVDLKKTRDLKKRKDNKVGEYAELNLKEYLAANNMDEEDLVNLYEKKDDQSIKKLAEILDKTLYKQTKGEYKVSINKTTKEPVIKYKEKIMIENKFINGDNKINFVDELMSFQEVYKKLGVDIDSRGTYDSYYEELDRSGVSVNVMLFPGDDDFASTIGWGFGLFYGSNNHDLKVELGVFFSYNQSVTYEGIKAKYSDLIDEQNIIKNGYKSYDLIKFNSKVERNIWGIYLSGNKMISNNFGLKSGLFFMPEKKSINLDYIYIPIDSESNTFIPSVNDTKEIDKSRYDGGVIFGTSLRYKKVSLEPSVFFSLYNKPIYQIGISLYAPLN